jgi:phage terminase large subunit-like protein
LELQPHQRDFFGYALTPNSEGIFPFETVLCSITKKSGKSLLAASVAAWGADELPDGSEIYIAANNREQAEGRVMRDLKFHTERSGNLYPVPPELRGLDGMPEDDARVTGYRILYPNDTRVEAITKSASGHAGSRHAISIWDELWGYTTRAELEMWDELTPIPTVPYSFRFIATYAGYRDKKGLLWDLYKKNVGPEELKGGLGVKVKELDPLPVYTNGSTITLWDHENRMPWQTKAYLKKQRSDARLSAYLRHHENRWVSSEERFIDESWWKAAEQLGERLELTQSAEYWLAHPYYSHPIVVGIDASTKHDSTALVGSVYDPEKGRVIQMFHKIWTPVEGEIFDLWETVGKEVLKLRGLFNIELVYMDPTQMHQIGVDLRKYGIEVVEYNQTVQKMVAASQTLYNLLKSNSLVVYEDEQMADQMNHAVAVETGQGFRIVKNFGGDDDNKIDYVIALALSVYGAIAHGGVYEPGETIRVRSAFGKQAQEPIEPDWLPEPLRSN